MREVRSVNELPFSLRAQVSQVEFAILEANKQKTLIILEGRFSNSFYCVELQRMFDGLV